MLRTSESIKNISSALAKAQSAFPDIPKDKTVKVKMKSGGEYSYKYAELSSIVKATRAPLSANELSFAQGIVKDGDLPVCITRLLHSSGEWFETSYPVLYSEDDMQGLAGGFTFARRYGLSAILGVATEEDTDGNGANREKPAKPRQQDPPKQQEAAAPSAPAKQQKIFEIPDKPLSVLEKMELGKFVIPGGPFKGKKLGEIPYDDLMHYKVEAEGSFLKSTEMMPPGLRDLLNRISAYYLDYNPA